MAYEIRGTAGVDLRFKPRGSPIVLDIGEGYVKGGIAGESRPRVIAPNQLNSDLDTPAHLLVTSGVSGESKETWIRALQPFVRNLFFRLLAVNPSERRVVILENPYWPLNFKAALLTVLFQLQVPGVGFVPIAPLPLYITGKESGGIIDIGFLETRITAVCSGFAVGGSLKSVPAAMKAIHTRLFNLLPQASGWSLNVVENVVTRTCVVLPLSPQDQEARRKHNPSKPQPTPLTNSLQAVTYSDGLPQPVTIPGEVRGGSGEALFGSNEEGFNIAHAFLDVLLKCDRDARAQVANNVILSGGTSALPGLAFRFLQEVDLALHLPKYSSLAGIRGKISLHKTAFPPHIIAWAGGSIVGSLDVPDQHFLTPEAFAKNGVPDWSVKTLEAVTSAPAAQAAQGGAAQGAAEPANDQPEDAAAEEEEEFLF